MRLIFFNTLLIYMAVIINSQKISQEQSRYSSQYQTPNSLFSSDRSIYLSADTQTPFQFYNLNNINKLSSNFLPQTQSKAHFSTPFSVMSSTMRPNADDDDEQDEIYKYRNFIPNITLNNTVTKVGGEILEKRDTSANSRINLLQSDKTPSHYVTKDTSNNQNKNFNQNPAARRMIITSEIQRSDQVKAGSFQNNQYIQVPGILMSSTEPAIPILRLSNEMDLDGSFSYEALGADQTHYVQHSRMENMGTDDEEQVVEGSYSYVGDDGRTYTVHYIADSNGYRATGEHLPSPPPIPEIIQRSVQYNLAEEARKPPHMRSSWENEENEYQTREESRNHPINIPSQRNLFTGKTPEAFSFGFAHNANPQSNIVTASSFHMPTKSNQDISKDQLKSKINNSPISPQVTFLATQGAHSPLPNQQQIQSTLQKIDHSDKLQLPQLMNYEAGIKENERDGNKGLWRWQYGLNPNGNQVASKNSISRSSFTEGDEVVINFNDMTPEQYTQTNMEGDTDKHYHTSYSNVLPRDNYNNINTQSVTISNLNDKNEIIGSTQTYDVYNQEPIKFTDIQTNNNIYQYTNPPTDSPVFELEELDKRSRIISINNFTPRSQTVTESYNFEETQFEPSKINKNNENSTNEYKYSQEYHVEYTTPISITNIDVNNTPLNYYQNGQGSSFKPIIYKSEYKPEINSQLITTTEPSVAELIKDNIFLRNLFKTPYSKEKLKQDFALPDSKLYQFKNPEPTTEKAAKLIAFTQSPQNEVKPLKHIETKHLNMNDVMNYVVMKNNFESIKTKPKSKSHTVQYINNLNDKYIPSQYIPGNKANDKNQEGREVSDEYAALNLQQQQELRGFIKNYKVLQRQKNLGHKNQILHEPQRHIKAFHPPGLPPLGRAGPSMKSYSPPTYI